MAEDIPGAGLLAITSPGAAIGGRRVLAAKLGWPSGCRAKLCLELGQGRRMKVADADEGMDYYNEPARWM